MKRNDLDKDLGILSRPLVADVSRRSFLKGALGSAIVAASAATLAACGGSSDAGAKSSAASVIRLGIADPGATFDTQQTSNTIGISENVTEGLYELDPETLEIKPLLAKSLPTISSDGLTYEIELKSDVKFQDGSKMTAEDVVYSFTRLIKLNMQADSYKKIVGADELANGTTDKLAGLEIVDETHIKFTLTEVFSSFTQLLCQFYANIYPKAAVEKAGDKWGNPQGKGDTFFGTGPYKIVDNDGSSLVKLEAFKDYHGGKPALPKIEINYIGDDSTLMNSYVAGDIDLCFVPKALLKQYKDDPEVGPQIVNYIPCATQFVDINLNFDGFKDAKVREALSLAIDRKTLCKTVLSGAADPCSCFIPKTASGHDDSLKPLAYDADKATKLLKEAGATNLTFPFVVRPQDKDVAVALQEFWKKVGVTANVQEMEPEAWRTARSNGELTATLVTWSTLSFIGVEFMGSFFRSDCSSRYSSFYNSPTFDGYVDAARAAMDDKTILENTKKADKLLTNEDFGTIVVDWPANPYVLRKGFKGLEVLVDFHFKNVKPE